MSEKILIIDDDVDTLKLVGLMLQRQGYDISAASNGEQGLVKAFAEKPDVILLDLMMPDMDGYEVARRLRKNEPTKSTPILMFTARSQLDDKVAGFEVGADDYLTKPTHPSELQAHVRALLERGSLAKVEVPAAAAERHGHMIAVLAARDGLGVSTLASNLAAAFLARGHPDAILAELTPGRGTLGMELGTPGPQGQNELLALKPAEITAQKVASVLLRHDSGLRLLLASENPRDVALANKTEHYQALFSALAMLAPFIVLDLGSGLPPFAEKILPLCDDCIVVTEGAPNTVMHTKVLLDAIVGLGIDPAGVTVILNNRMRAETQMPWAEVQRILGHAVLTTLTPAPELMISAARRHMPAVLTEPTNSTAQQILKVADQILEHEKAR